MIITNFHYGPVRRYLKASPGTITRPVHELGSNTVTLFLATSTSASPEQHTRLQIIHNACKTLIAALGRFMNNAGEGPAR